MHETVLSHADIDECPKVRHVRNDALEFGALIEIFNVRYALEGLWRPKAFPPVPARPH